MNSTFNNYAVRHLLFVMAVSSALAYPLTGISQGDSNPNTGRGFQWSWEQRGGPDTDSEDVPAAAEGSDVYDRIVQENIQLRRDNQKLKKLCDEAQQINSDLFVKVRDQEEQTKQAVVRQDAQSLADLKKQNRELARENDQLKAAIASAQEVKVQAPAAVPDAELARQSRLLQDRREKLDAETRDILEKQKLLSQVEKEQGQKAAAIERKQKAIFEMAEENERLKAAAGSLAPESDQAKQDDPKVARLEKENRALQEEQKKLAKEKQELLDQQLSLSQALEEQKQKAAAVSEQQEAILAMAEENERLKAAVATAGSGVEQAQQDARQKAGELAKENRQLRDEQKKLEEDNRDLLEKQGLLARAAEEQKRKAEELEGKQKAMQELVAENERLKSAVADAKATETKPATAGPESDLFQQEARKTAELARQNQILRNEQKKFEEEKQELLAQQKQLEQALKEQEQKAGAIDRKQKAMLALADKIKNLEDEQKRKEEEKQKLLAKQKQLLQSVEQEKIKVDTLAQRQKAMLTLVEYYRGKASDSSKTGPATGAGIAKPGIAAEKKPAPPAVQQDMSRTAVAVKPAVNSKEEADLLYNAGVLYTDSGMYKEAEKSFLKVLELDPVAADAYYNLGVLYDENLNDREKAARHYKKFLELDPFSEDAQKVKLWLLETEMK